MLKIIFAGKGEWEKMLEFSRQAYPEEGCGFLLGSRLPDKKVVKIFPARNVNPDHKKDRYQISPEEFYRIEKEAENQKLEIIGFFHTHPDHPALPSAYDLSRAWENYSYFILSVSKSKTEVKSWVVGSGRKFVEEKIILI